ncbi:hypothetical protein LC593_04760 [Nostoc sp. CHAB 5844]|nr:hypothetical protein [Nostoc sp. CHAB 5844]
MLIAETPDNNEFLLSEKLQGGASPLGGFADSHGTALATLLSVTRRGFPSLKELAWSPSGQTSVTQHFAISQNKQSLLLQALNL